MKRRYRKRWWHDAELRELVLVALLALAAAASWRHRAVERHHAKLADKYRIMLLKELAERLNSFQNSIESALAANGNDPKSGIAVEIAVDRLLAEAEGSWIGPTIAERERERERDYRVALTAAGIHA